jgi:hypothetical protein
MAVRSSGVSGMAPLMGDRRPNQGVEWGVT